MEVGPAFEEGFLRGDARELAGDGAIDVRHHPEVGGEEDVEIALLYLRGSQYSIERTCDGNLLRAC